MTKTKPQIIAAAASAAEKCKLIASSISDACSLDDYSSLVRRDVDGREIWTDALRRAVSEHNTVVIPPRYLPYYIDGQIVLSSLTRIVAHGATIIQTPDCKLLMLRNASAADGTHKPVSGRRDCGIFIEGGRWEESRTRRGGYGTSGMFDESRSFYGVSSLFYFSNLDCLSIIGATFAHTAGFAVQVGDVSDCVFEDIAFDSCYADGLHINGGTKRCLCRNISGEVGDDLVALNAYDWQNSSVNFGKIEDVWCENLDLAESSPYKAMRLETGIYRYDDASRVDCAIDGAVIRHVRGIRTFKLYFQTPRYKIGETPEWGEVGSASSLYFDDVTVDLAAPLDGFDEFTKSDPVRGSFAAFELGANIGLLSLENIDLKLYQDKFPYSYLVCCGPKSVRVDVYEIFDPYLSSETKRLVMQGIIVNGLRINSTDDLVREIEFYDVNCDGNSTGRGKIDTFELKV